MGTLNIRTMSGMGRELEDVLERRNVNICAYRKQSGKGVKQGTLKMAANYSTMEQMAEEIG